MLLFQIRMDDWHPYTSNQPLTLMIFNFYNSP
jgi:hypothetical protein